MTDRMLRVKIEKAHREHAYMTRITDAETGEEVTGVFGYTLVADVKVPRVVATLHRFVEPFQMDPETQELLIFDEDVEVVHLDTDAIEVDP